MFDSLITQPLGDLGDSAHPAFGLVSIQPIAELQLNIAVPNSSDRDIDRARIETDEDFLQV